MTSPVRTAADMMRELVKTSRHFNGKVKETDCGCWEWTGGVNKDGYGYFYRGGRSYRAHRFAYEFFNGRIQSGQVVMHTCDNPRCVHPEHLIVGTQAKNVADCIQKGRKNPARGEAAGRAKLTAAEVIALRSRHAQQPYRWSEIEAEAARLCVSPRAIDKVLKGQSWKGL